MHKPGQKMLLAVLSLAFMFNASAETEWQRQRAGDLRNQPLQYSEPEIDPSAIAPPSPDLVASRLVFLTAGV